jgi:hypothetical protein
MEWNGTDNIHVTCFVDIRIVREWVDYRSIVRGKVVPFVVVSRRQRI